MIVIYSLMLLIKCIYIIIFMDIVNMLLNKIEIIYKYVYYML